MMQWIQVLKCFMKERHKIVVFGGMTQIGDNEDSLLAQGLDQAYSKDQVTLFTPM